MEVSCVTRSLLCPPRPDTYNDRRDLDGAAGALSGFRLYRPFALSGLLPLPYANNQLSRGAADDSRTA